MKKKEKRKKKRILTKAQEIKTNKEKKKVYNKNEKEDFLAEYRFLIVLFGKHMENYKIVKDFLFFQVRKKRNFWYVSILAFILVYILYRQDINYTNSDIVENIGKKIPEVVNEIEAKIENSPIPPSEKNEFSVWNWAIDNKGKIVIYLLGSVFVVVSVYYLFTNFWDIINFISFYWYMPSISPVAKEILNEAMFRARNIPTSESLRHSELIGTVRSHLNNIIAERAVVVVVQNIDAQLAAAEANMIAAAMGNGKNIAIEANLIVFDQEKVLRECLEVLFYIDQRRR